MTGRMLLASGLLVSSMSFGCATKSTATWTATAQLVKRTGEGGMILLRPGSAPQAAARDALATIVAQCGDEFEIVETSRTTLYRDVPLPPSTVDEQPTVYGTSVLYLCRKPEATVLNEAFAAFASQDFLGKVCSSDQDCRFYKCTRPTGPSPDMICTAADGSIPVAREGESCDSKPCMAPLDCSKRGSGSLCVKP